MTYLFEIIPDDDVWGNQYYINASHKWGLPGVICPLCGETWISVGLNYPSVDLTGLPNEKRYREFNAVALEKLEELITAIKPLLPQSAILRPGADLGPLVGTAQGKYSDFLWTNLWTLLVQNRVLDCLKEKGVNMPQAVPAILKHKRKETQEILELQIEPYTRIAASAYPSKVPPPCASCGREELKRPRKIVIERSSVPDHVDIFRGRDITTLLLATDRFVEAVRTLRLSNILFRKVEVA